MKGRKKSAGGMLGGASALSKWSRCEDVIRALPEGCEELRHATTIITGPTTGIGVNTAMALASLGGRLVLAARSEAKAEALKAQIEASMSNPGPVSWIELDLRSLRSVAAFAQQFAKMSDAGGWPPLKCLVCNAGILNINGRYQATADGFEETFGVNHLGHFYLTRLLLPRLRDAAPSRVVYVSSGSHLGSFGTTDIENSDTLHRLAKPDEDTRRRFGHRESYGAYCWSKLVRIPTFPPPEPPHDPMWRGCPLHGIFMTDMS